MGCRYCDENLTQQQSSLQALAKYQYIPLTGSRNVRLFTVRKGASGEPIRGDLSVADLDDPSVNYQALSYTWGTSQPSHPIECNGAWLTVNCNLFSALHRLREDDQDCRWFIDFLCINQSLDPDWLSERASQVRLMGAVYRTASSVLIDLGEEPERMAHVVLLMQKCCTVSMDDIQRKAKRLDEFQAPPFTLDVWDSFVALCQRSWFQRIWVLQEYALARTAAFMIGRERYPEQLVMSSISIAFILAGITRQNREAMSLVRYKIRSANTLVSAMEFASTRHDGDSPPSPSTMTLVEALKRTATFDASDKHDRIYGLLGLVGGTDMSDFDIDYAESLDACSRRLSHFLVQQGSLVDLFHTLACWSPEGHPSWMINLGAYRRPAGLDRLFLKAWNKLPYNAGGREAMQAELVNGGAGLKLRGMIVDHVDITSAPFPIEPENESLDLMPVFLKSVRDWDAVTIEWVLENLYAPGTNLKAIVRDYRLAATCGGHGLENYRSLTKQELENFLWDKLNDRSLRNKLFPRRKERALDALSHVMSLMTIFCESKRIGICKTGRLCSIPEQGMTGDAITIFRGAPVPFLLRKTEADAFRVVGGVYLCRTMNGELCRELGAAGDEITLC